MNYHLDEIEKVRREMDESGLGEDISVDENIAFWIVAIVALACLCAVGYWLYKMAVIV